MKTPHKLLRPADLAAAAGILLGCLALLLFTRSGGGKTAEITVGSEIVARVDLTRVEASYTMEPVPGVTLEVRPGEIAFTRSTCKGQDCVRCGALSVPGQIAACLPNRTVVRIVGSSGEEVPDAIVY